MIVVASIIGFFCKKLLPERHAGWLLLLHMDVKSLLVVQLALAPERGSVPKASGRICTSSPVGWVPTADKRKNKNKNKVCFQRELLSTVSDWPRNKPFSLRRDSLGDSVTSNSKKCLATALQMLLPLSLFVLVGFFPFLFSLPLPIALSFYYSEAG